MHLAIFISGLAAVMSQALLIRESLAFFSGNELVSGIVLFFWLLWTGLGSILYSRWKPKCAPVLAYALLLFILCITLIFSLLFFRIAPVIFSLPFGEIVGFEKIIIISVITLCPTCLVFGALFPSASSIILAQKVYLIEGFGSFVGGLLFSFLLASVLPPFGILLIIISLLLFAGLLCLKKNLLMVLCLLPLFLLIKINDLEFFFRKVQVPGQQLIGLYESRYGAIAITQTESQLNFYSNGFFDFAYPDNYTAEEAVHYPLLLHYKPEDVLLIGGGMAGGINEILKHRTVKKLIYLELDPKIIEVSRKYISSPVDDRLNIVIADGRFFIKNTKDKFDCIIINLSDPINAQLNRYYTKEFFQEVKSRLKSDGLFSIRVTAPSDILSPIYKQFLGTIYRSLQSVFKNIYVLPAAKTTYIAGDYAITEKMANILKQRIEQRKLDLIYVNSYFFDYNFTDERIDYLKASIEQSRAYTNTDLKPVCYYFSNMIYGGIISENLKWSFVRLSRLHPIIFFLPLIMLLLFWHRKTIIYLSVFSVGAGGISAELILLILFQVFYGYVYAWFGIIIGLFMLGLSCGTFIYIRFKKKLFENYLSSLREQGMVEGVSTLSLIQLSIALYFLVILIMSIVKIPGASYAIGVLVFIGGFFGGLHFPLSVEILGNKRAGILYGIDLLGSSFGAIMTTIILIPILGILYTLLIFIILNILVSIGLKRFSVKQNGSLISDN